MNEHSNATFQGDVSIVLAGPAGLGINTTEQLISGILRAAEYHVFSTSEFMSRIRGGSNTTEIRVASRAIAAYVNKIDILIPLDSAAIAHCEKRISPSTIILGEATLLHTELPIINVPFEKAAIEAGGKLYSGSVAAGCVCALMNVAPDTVTDHIRRHFGAKDASVADKNAIAALRGHQLGIALLQSNVRAINVANGPSVNNELFLCGSDAIGLGALFAGCDFVSSYPMSPSTGVLTFLAQHKNDFGLVVEQAEDEIAAVNMALGAWYAGARALVTTSGGGFALMTEGISLSGMIETPVVVHVGQRPGPATGLPTRTEQADLELVLHAGHGEFPRAVFAPGTLPDAIEVMRRAFSVADKYQIPTFVLTDQFFLDSYAGMERIDTSQFTVEKHVVKTEAGYERYALSDSGISPRGIPGNGDGLVRVDSDEHTPEGLITEDLDLRTKMVDKRFKKATYAPEDIMPPHLVGPETFVNIVVCWGSTYHAVREALETLKLPDTAMLHITQVHPFHDQVGEALAQAQCLIVVENNATGQLAKLIKVSLGRESNCKILKYNGMSFSVEELVEKIGALVQS